VEEAPGVSVRGGEDRERLWWVISGYEAMVQDHAVLGLFMELVRSEPILSANGELSRDPTSSFFPFSSWVYSPVRFLSSYHGLLEALPFFILIFPVP
jgi:hypothetical protein